MQGKHYLNIFLSKDVASRKDLTPNDKLIYGLITTLGDVKKETTVSNDYLANNLEISITTVKRSLKKLKDKKLIDSEITNQYRTIKII